MSYNELAEPFPGTHRLRRLLVRNVVSLIGLGVLALAAFVAASLVTWNVDDPSLSNAADKQPDNILGFPGAIASDLMMQFIGLASIGWLVVLIIVGWNLVLLRAPQRLLLQSLMWIFGTLFLSAALACLPTNTGWPLPTGLGGACGDLLMSIPNVFLEQPISGGLFAAAFVACAGIGVGLLLAATAARPSPYVSRLSLPDQIEEFDYEIEDQDEEDDESYGAWRIFMGGLTHRIFATRAMLNRRFGRMPMAFVRGNQSDDDPVALERHEPQFQDDEADGDMENQVAYVPDLAPIAPIDPPESKSRVKPNRAKTQPGKRAIREAQKSLLPSDEFELPPLQLLSEPKPGRRDRSLDPAALEQNARLLEGVLDDFGVRGAIINVRPGPVVTLYELEPAPGIKSSRIIGLADDIARSMSAIAARVAVIPGRNVIGIELPNASRETVFLREILDSTDYEKTRAKLALTLGKSINGEPVIADLAKMPHLLVAGTTGSGKSVAINTMIISLLYRLTPEQCRLIMIDPKMLELSIYEGIPHLLTPVVTDPKKAVVALKWTVREMEDRYRKMSKVGVRNIDGFNQRVQLAKKKGEVISRTVQTGFDHETGEAIFETEELDLEPIPFIVVIIDEMADLMMVAGKDIEAAVQRLAQMARAAGIHVIMATQRPSVDVITGTIKANFPTRISFQVTSKIDSRTILGEQGAEQLLGMGDMLHMAGGGRIKRVHGAFVSDDEVEEIVAHLKAQGQPEYLETVTDEDENDVMSEILESGSSEGNELYDKAVAVVLRDGKASTSYIQRRLSIGYNRAATLIEKMEEEGVVGPANHAGKREILVGEHAA